MKVLVIGNGAREHTMVWKLARSPRVDTIYITPGNAGTKAIARNLDISPTDIEALAGAARQYGIDLTVVGPEAPLAKGIVDLFQIKGLAIFGSTEKATQLESSKVFARDLMRKYGIPCARGKVFTSPEPAGEYIMSQPCPVVVKADGLAAGKGVIVASSHEEALQAVSDMMEKKVFGAAGDSVIVEECLEGKEVSLLAFTDGKTVTPMVPACDYKRAYDGDQGLNTGGMGSYSPPDFFGQPEIELVQRTILEPAVQAMAKEGIPYKGVLYAGLMITPDGPKVLEFNARFGDPETQVILPRLKTDFVDIIEAIIEDRLDGTKIEWSDQACVGVVLASGGYPGSYKTGLPISGLDKLSDDILVFHAGTKGTEQIVTDGGRVLTVTAMGKDLADARAKVYDSLPGIRFDNCHYRTDIAAL